MRLFLVARPVLAVAVAVQAACHAASPAPATSSATPATATATTTAQRSELLVGVSTGETFSPGTSDAALKAFVPEVAPVDSGGECMVTRTAGSGATIVSAFFPKRAGSQTQMTMTFDSSGKLVRFSDMRGVPRIPSTRGMPDAQRDSTVRAAIQATRSTSITLDYPVDRAMVMNRGGGRPTNAISGNVRAIEKLESLGPPTARLERARKLCGV